MCEDLDYVLFPRCPVVRTSSFKNMRKSAGFWASLSSAHEICAISTNGAQATPASLRIAVAVRAREPVGKSGSKKPGRKYLPVCKKRDERDKL